MARPRKIRPEAATAAKQAAPAPVGVIGSTLEEEAAAPAVADTVVLSVSLRCGHVFDDIPDGAGGVKCVRLAGLDDHLKGKKGGILAPAGNAVFQTIARADWEHIKQLHGGERMFTSWQGRPPCVFEIESAKAAKSEAVKQKIAAGATGADPIDPRAEGLTEADLA